jgi:DNA-binding CsgD family transcriptional regulator
VLVALSWPEEHYIQKCVVSGRAVEICYMEHTIHLTKRQCEILYLGALGYSDKNIAKKLGIGGPTVKVYFHVLRQRIGAFDRAMIPAIGIALGLVTVDELIDRAVVLMLNRKPPVVPVNFPVSRLLAEDVSRRGEHIWRIKMPGNC